MIFVPEMCNKVLKAYFWEFLWQNYKTWQGTFVMWSDMDPDTHFTRIVSTVPAPHGYSKVYITLTKKGKFKLKCVLMLFGCQLQ
eukprot:UN22874